MKYDFCTKPWFAALHGIMAQRAVLLHRERPTHRASICEIFCAVPSALSGGTGEIVWSCVLENGRAHFRLAERDDVEFKVRAEYAAIVPIVRFDTKREPERIATLVSMVAKAQKAGRITNLIGNGYQDLPHVDSAHDLIARITS